MLVASIVGAVLGQDVTAFFVISVVIISVAGPLVVVFTAVTSAGISLKPEQPPGPEFVRTLARIESLKESGVVVASFNHLFQFTVTMFPANEPAQRFVFSQFITMGQLPNFYTGRYVVVAAKPDGGWLLDPEPSQTWAAKLRAAPELYDDVQGAAAAAEPAKPAVKPTAPVVSRGRNVLNWVLVALCVLVGFFGSTLLIFGGVSRALTTVQEAPLHIRGEVHGLWDSKMLELDLADLRQQLAGRELQSVVIFDNRWSMRARSTTDPEGIDTYTFAGGRLDTAWLSTGSPDDATFSIDQVDANVLRAVLAQVYAERPDAEVENVHMSVSHRGGLTMSVSIEGAYQSTYLEFDARTGEPISND